MQQAIETLPGQGLARVVRNTRPRLARGSGGSARACGKLARSARVGGKHARSAANPILAHQHRGGSRLRDRMAGAASSDRGQGRKPSSGCGHHVSAFVSDRVPRCDTRRADECRAFSAKTFCEDSAPGPSRIEPTAQQSTWKCEDVAREHSRVDELTRFPHVYTMNIFLRIAESIDRVNERLVCWIFLCPR